MVVSKNEVSKVDVVKSDLIWDTIKNLPLDIFGLADKVVSDFCSRELKEDPETVYLKVKATAVIPALDEAVLKAKINKSMKIVVTQGNRYVTVTMVAKE